jgi:hypothetical protein
MIYLIIRTILPNAEGVENPFVWIVTGKCNITPIGSKCVVGITALGIGLAFWKGKDLLSLWDRIKEKME